MEENRSTALNNTSMFAYSEGFSISFILITTTIFAFGVLGNTALMSSILKTKTLRSSPTFIVLFSMAVSDLLRVSFIGLHLNLQLVYSSWIAGNLWCQFFLFIMFTMAHIGNSHVALIAVFRYVILVHPFFTKRIMTTKKALLICGSIWLCLSLVNLPMAMSTGLKATPISGRKTTTCQPTSPIVYLARCLACYLLPLAIIVGFHIAKIIQLSSSTVQRQAIVDDKQKIKQVSHVSVLLIILTFVICWLPKAIVWFLAGAFELNVNGGVLLTTSTCMSYANSALNPVIYFFSVKRLRKTVCCVRALSQENTSTDHNREYISLSRS